MCQHMGHTKDMHKENYQLPIQAIQMGKIGHHLLKLDGSLITMKDKTNSETQASCSGRNSTVTSQTIVDEENDRRTINSTEDEYSEYSPSSSESEEELMEG